MEIPRTQNLDLPTKSSVSSQGFLSAVLAEDFRFSFYRFIFFFQRRFGVSLIPAAVNQ